MRIKLLSVFLLLLIIAGNLYAQEELNVPEPPKAVMLDTREIELGGLKIQSFLFESQTLPENISKFYLEFFNKNKFEPEREAVDKNTNLLRFRKEDLVINIAITPSAGKARVVIAQYHQPQGVPGPEELLRNWKNSQQFFPKTDVAGEDLEAIPRPPESIRIFYNKNKITTYIFYSSQDSVKNLVNFYRYKMLSFGWEAQEPINMQEEFERVKNSPMNKKIPQIPLTGISVGKLVEGGYILKFKSSAGKVEISIFNNNYGPDVQGSLIQVSYVQEK
ncbi:MAG: hypothetical protein HZC15_07170 [Candidatus Omnitrophica bacterium]|nr:hypothetical protein [Candidatus Omnitrophota bacterium]